MDTPMILILEGNPKRGANVWSEKSNLNCSTLSSMEGGGRSMDPSAVVLEPFLPFTQEIFKQPIHGIPKKS